MDTMQSISDIIQDPKQGLHALLTPDVLTRLADILNQALPKYVSAWPSIKIGLVVMAVVTLFFVVVAMFDRKHNKSHKNVFLQSRWMLCLVCGVIVAHKIGEFVQEKHYTIRCIKTNRQHYANVHWLRLYRRAYLDHGTV